MSSKQVLLVIAQKGFQPLEYGEPKRILESAGIKVVTAGLEEGVAESSFEEKTVIDIDLANVKVEDYDGIFFIGGPGALEYLDNEKSYKMIKATAKSDKLWGAICISPRILASAGVLKGKKVTGWDGDGELARILERAGAQYLKESVVADGNLITANGPGSAKKFGDTILSLLK